LGAALLHLADTFLPFKQRELGFKILLLHDVLEDTSLSVPDWVEAEVRKGVEEMTYAGSDSIQAKRKWIQSQNPFIRLLILYDMFWSLYERHVSGSAERKTAWAKAVLDLADDAEKNYGDIRIVQIARVVASNANM
jgi:hypothetical protein